MRSNQWNLAQQWQRYTTPTRPDKTELTQLASFIKPKADVLILGSTPEYRDLCHLHHAHVTCVDLHPDNFAAMSRLMQHQSDDRLLVQGWNELKLDENYDLILADHSLNLLSLSEWSTLFLELKNHLHPGGTFIPRVVLLDPQFRPNLEEIFTPLIEQKSCLSHSLYDLFHYVVQRDTQCFTGLDLFNALQQAKDKNVISPEHYEELSQLNWADSQVICYLPTENTLTEKLSQYWQIQQILSGDIHYRHLTKFYVCSANTC